MKPELHKILTDSHLILDTDILIRVNHEAALRMFFQECRLLPCSLLSILPVEIELLKGAKDAQKARKSQALLHELVQYMLPVDQESLANALQLTLVYGIDAHSVSLTDFLLAGVLMKYRESRIYLMSGDISAFPTDIFDLLEVFQVIKRRQILNFGIYAFSQDKFDAKLRRFLQ